MEGRRLIFMATSAQPLNTSFTESFSLKETAADSEVYTMFGLGILYKSWKTDPIMTAIVPTEETNRPFSSSQKFMA